jgi:chromosome partitioning protein
MVKEEFNEEALTDYAVPVEPADDVAGARDLSVMPSSLRIDDFQRNYNKASKKFHGNDEFHAVLGRRLRAFRNWLNANFDYTIIDCPPSLAIQVQMLVKVADTYVVPSVPDKLSVRGSHYLVERLRRKQFKIPGLGTLWSLYREQNVIHREMIRLAEHHPELFVGLPKAFKTIIPNSTDVARAMESSHKSPDVKYTPKIASKYRELVGEITARCRRLPIHFEHNKLGIPPKLERKFDDPWSRTSRANAKKHSRGAFKNANENLDSFSSQKLRLHRRVEGVSV